MPVAAQPVLPPPSISTSANLHVINDPVLPVVDSVSLSMELFSRVFPHSQTKASNQAETFFVLIKLIGVPDFFPNFKIYKVSSIEEQPVRPNSVTITNHANFTRFGTNLTVTGCIVQSIDSESIPLLEAVFIAVPPAIYDILALAPQLEVKERLISSYLAQLCGTVSQNDAIRAINGSVTLCKPFYQGRVTTNTELVFISRQQDSFTAPKATATSPEPAIDLSQFLARSMVFSASADSSELLEFKVAPLPHEMSVAQTQSVAEDSLLYAFMSTDDIAKLSFPVLNGDMVYLCSGDSRTLVKVFTIIEPNKTFSRGTIYLSPLLLINMDLSNDSRVQLEPVAGSDRNFSDVIPVAKSATISRIVSPITMDKTYQQSFFAELKSTFHTQMKCFKQGDLFPVCIDSMLAKALFESSAHSLSPDEAEGQEPEIVPTGHPDSVAWFKVVDISGLENSPTSQYIIQPSKTTLISSGVEFVALPKNHFSQWHQFLQMPPLFNYRKYPQLFKFAQEFYQVVVTTVRSYPRVELRTTILLHSMSRALGKTTVVRSTALDLGLNLIELDAVEFVKPGAELKTIGLLTGKIEKQLNGQSSASNCSAFHILYIKHIESLCVETDPNEQSAALSTSLSLKVVKALRDILLTHKNIILVASSNDIDKVNSSFRQMMTFEIGVLVPSEYEREAIFEHLIEKETKVTNRDHLPDPYEGHVEFCGRPKVSKFPTELRSDVNPQTLALQSAGLTPRDLMSIIRKSKQLAISRLMASAAETKISLEKLVKIGNGGTLLLNPDDFDKAINDARNEFSDSIGAPRIPNVKWADIGGLDLVKNEILDTIDMPLKHPELFSNGLKKRSGILFYGPPGTGKTLLAKAIATNFSLNFFSVKGPELLNMYIGESEANVRRVFQKARDAKPCVIFFDELDSVAPKRGNQGDSGGVMDRIVSQLLAELDGMSGGENNGSGVFVVGATNRPDLLDEALLRPGRFDKMLYLGISDTDDKQAKILEALTRKFHLSDEVDLHKIAERCSFTLTGADFYALCSDLMLNAMTRAAGEVDQKLKKFNAARAAQGLGEVSSRWWFDNEATDADVKVLVTMADFEKAQRELVPSVSSEELEHYLRVKQNFEGMAQKD